jgi:phage regulator Rha-like protein
MNMMTQFNHNQNSMTSLEIAELVQSRHDKVKQSIERLAERGVITLPPMGEKSTAGRPTTFYIFSGEQGKRDSIIVVAQLCPEFTARLVDRWQELENKASFDITNPVHLLEAIEVQAKLNIELTEKVAVYEPKAQALDQIADTSSSFCIREAAKTIGLTQNKLIEFMLHKRWIYRNNDRKHTLCAYAERCTQGVMTNKVTQVISTPEGDQVYTQARITAYGLTRLTALAQKAGLVQGVAA